MLRLAAVIGVSSAIGVGLMGLLAALKLGVGGVYGVVALSVLVAMPLAVRFVPFVADAWHSQPTELRRTRTG